MVDQGGPPKLEELLEDLQDDYGSVETLPKEVENLLQELHSGEDFLSRHHAAAALGRIGTGYPQVQRALQAASESDPHAAVREAAAQALQAPGHQELLLGQPDLMRETERALQPPAGSQRQRSGSELSRVPFREDIEDMVLSRRGRVRILALVYGLVVVAVTVPLFAFRHLLPSDITTSLWAATAVVWLGGTVLGLVILRRKGYAVVADVLEVLGSALFGAAEGLNWELGCALMLLLAGACALVGPIVLITALLLEPRDWTRRRSS